MKVTFFDGERPLRRVLILADDQHRAAFEWYWIRYWSHQSRWSYQIKGD